MLIYSIIISLLLSGQQLYAAEASSAQSELFSAVAHRDKSALKAALAAGAQPLLYDQSRGETPVHTLLKQRVEEKEEVYPLLGLMIENLQKPVAIPSVGNSIRGFLGMPLKISSPQINFDVVDAKGETPFTYAVKNDHGVSAYQLKKRGANPDHVYESGHTMLHRLVKNPSPLGCREHLNRALSSGLDINATNDDGRTALTEAVLSGNNEAVEHLLMYLPEDFPRDALLIFPRDVEARDRNGKRAVDYADEAASSGEPLVENRILRFLKAGTQ